MSLHAHSTRASSIRRFGAVRTLFIAASLLLFSCSLSSDEPLQWKSVVELPVVSTREFLLGRMIDTLFFGGDQVVTESYLDTVRRSNGTILRIDTLYDTTMQISGAYGGPDDTVVFSVTSEESKEGTISEKIFEQENDTSLVGSISLSKAPAVSRLVPLADGPLAIQQSITLDKIYGIHFTPSSTPLKATLRNPGTGTVAGTQFGIEGFDTVDVGDLSPGDSMTVDLICADKLLDSTPVMLLGGMVSGSTPGNALSISVSFAGTEADSIVMLDSLADFSRMYTTAYKISDSVDIDYIDIKFGFFYYHVVNQTPMRLHVERHHRHLWIGDQCELRDIKTWEEIAGSGIDSLYNAGDMPLRDIEPHFRNDFEQLSLSGTRLFPEWQPDSQMCISNVDYHITTLPRGDRISLTAHDTLIFSIGATSFKFDKLEGTIVNEWHRNGDTSWVPVELPFPETVTDSLRGRFVLSDATAAVRVTMAMPVGSQLDTMKLRMRLFDVRNPSMYTDTTACFVRVHDDTTFETSLNVAGLVGGLPDSIGVISETQVPVGTRMKVVSDLAVNDSDYATLMGRMTIHSDLRYQFNAHLDWAVTDTITLDLDRTDFEAGDVEFFSRLTDRAVAMHLSVVNNTHMPMAIFGLIAAEEHRDDLFALPLDSVTWYARHPESLIDGNRYASLFGADGVRIPLRDSGVFDNDISLDDYTIGKLIDSPQTGIRWFVRLPVTDRDHLAGSDGITLNAWLRVEGNTSSDAVVKPY